MARNERRYVSAAVSFDGVVHSHRDVLNFAMVPPLHGYRVNDILERNRVQNRLFCIAAGHDG
jgi:hypothetical protein